MGADYFDANTGLTEELGDCLWYLTVCAHRTQSSLSKIAATALSDVCTVGQYRPKTFEEFDALCGEERLDSLKVRQKCSELARASGEILGAIYEGGGSFRERLPRIHLQMAIVLVTLLLLARHNGIPLAKVAESNIQKTASRWPIQGNRVRSKLFDDGLPQEDRLPRRLQIRFVERNLGARSVVHLRVDDLNIGDRLTDNISEGDGYRYHDVFHLAYAAVLGWSPVTRALLKCKRKSRPDKDENEDGARAAIIEEAIATIAFNDAKRHNFYADQKPLEYGLLKTIAGLTRGYEVEVCKLWEWEDAILTGFKVFNLLKGKAPNGGLVAMDLGSRTLELKE